jgi:hypothetical protein
MGSFECCQAELLQQNRKWSSEPLMAGSHQFGLTAIIAFNFITPVGQVRLVPGLFVILVYILSMGALCLPSRNVNGEFVGSSPNIMILLGSNAE